MLQKAEGGIICSRLEECSTWLAVGQCTHRVHETGVAKSVGYRPCVRHAHIVSHNLIWAQRGMTALIVSLTRSIAAHQTAVVQPAAIHSTKRRVFCALMVACTAVHAGDERCKAPVVAADACEQVKESWHYPHSACIAYDGFCSMVPSCVQA